MAASGCDRDSVLMGCQKGGHPLIPIPRENSSLL